MLKTIWRKFGFFFAVLAVLGSVIVLTETIPESTFELASESRLPKWIALPPGLTRADVSLAMSYYTAPWGGSARFTLRDTKGHKLATIRGKLRGLYPLQLRHPPQGFAPGYPSYEVATAGGITEIIEHKQMEPVFYISDDPAVLKELGVARELY